MDRKYIISEIDNTKFFYLLMISLILTETII